MIAFRRRSPAIKAAAASFDAGYAAVGMARANSCVNAPIGRDWVRGEDADRAPERSGRIGSWIGWLLLAALVAMAAGAVLR